jgi:hypothetical protein
MLESAGSGLDRIEIARGLRDRRATVREPVDAAIARHESVGKRLHAYSFWAPEQARAVADAADAALGVSPHETWMVGDNLEWEIVALPTMKGKISAETSK